MPSSNRKDKLSKKSQKIGVKYFALGTEIALSIGAAFYFGPILDKKFNTTPYLLFSLLFFVALLNFKLFYNLFKDTQSIIQEKTQEDVHNTNLANSETYNFSGSIDPLSEKHQDQKKS